MTQIPEEARDGWGWRWAEDFLADIRYGARRLGRDRLVTAAVVITLALGIGANAALFAAVHAVLLQPLPFPDPGDLVVVHESLPGRVQETGSPLARILARSREADTFTDAGAYWDVSGSNGVVFGAAESTLRVRFSIVTNGFLHVLGVQPALGRAFSDEEGTPGGGKVFLASDAMWRHRLASDPAAVGKRFRIDGESYTLVGVLPPDFQYPDGTDVWMPLGVLPARQAEDRVSHQFAMVAHLRKGISPAQAAARLNTLQARWARTFVGTDADWRVTVTPLLDAMVGHVRTALWVLMACAGLVLLIACANVTSLLLARSAAGEKEFAVRLALGAGRGRLVRQVLSDTLLLVTIGTALALGLARLGLEAVVAAGAGSIPRLAQPEISGVVLAFSIVLALVTTALVGLVPAWRAGRPAPAQSMQAGQRSGFVSRTSRQSGRRLVVLEVALTVLLLSAAGVMMRSLQQLRQVDPGFRPAHLATVRLALPDATYPTADRRSAFLQTLLPRLNGTPGIELAAAVDRLPLSGDRNWSTVTIVGASPLDPAHAPSVEARSVSPGYFQALGIPLLHGRAFTDDDVARAQDVVLINRAMADAFWPGRDPTGQAIASPYHPSAPPRRIVGVVGNVREFSLDAQSPPEMYTPIRWWNEANIVVRSRLDPEAIDAAVRAHVNAIDRGVAVYGAASFEDLVSGSVARQRFELLLLALFASMALALAAVGIYGVLAFSVARRTHEIGVRLALGATARRATALVVRDGMTLVIAGIAVGLAASLALIRLMQSLLFRVSPGDPLTLACVAALLIGVGLVACIVPARRAMRVDPIAALRAE